MGGTAPDLHALRYRHGLWVMRGGLAVAVIGVLLIPAGELQLLVFLGACLGVAWGAWQRRRHCPLRQARRAPEG